MHTYNGIVSPLSTELCNCFAVRQAARRITRLYERHLAEADLTSAQFSILVAVCEVEDITMSELADAMGMDRTTLVRALKPLERRQWIRTAKGSAPRQLHLSLTPAGRRQKAVAEQCWRAAQSEFEREVGSERAERMRRDLLDLSI
jgi:DNA-binding MarR family transcriptional regulator